MRTLLLTFLGLGLSAFLTAAPAEPTNLLVLAQDFQFPGGWMVETRDGSIGTRILRTPGTDLNALTGIVVPTAGEYKVWVHTVDFPHMQPGERRFTVAINGHHIGRDAGQHGKEGWAWEPLGTVKLTAGENVVEIVDTARFFGRFDALVLAGDTDFDPGALSKSALLRLKAAPSPLAVEPVTPRNAADPSGSGIIVTPGRQVAALENSAARVRFFAHDDGQGDGVISRETDVRTASGEWIPVPSDPTAESLFVLRTDDNTIEAGQIHPRWRNPDNELLIHSGGHTYRTAGDSANPYRAAPSTTYIARSARTRADGSVELSFTAIGGEPVTVVWRNAPGGGDFDVRVSIKPSRDGFYSVGSAPFRASNPDEVRFNLLQPLYQFQRAPVRPMMVPSSVTPQPLSVIELAATADRPAITLGVAAEPAELPFEWPNAINARYGFALQSDDGQLQPSVFRPLLGLGDSEWKAGEIRTVRWRVLARAGDWRDTLSYATHRIFGVTDERHPVKTSLTDAALNMVSLMQDEKGGGFDASLRGFWNIEGAGVATQASPLTLLSASILTDDEALYVSQGLPAIEWTLTRAIAHMARVVPNTHPPYVTDKTIRITSPSRFYGAAYWQGVHALLGEANPWMADLVKRAVARGPAQKWTPKFADTLALYRLNPSAELLARAEKQAADYVAKEIDGRKTGDLGYTPFYNHDFIPVWWDLLALHELTGNTRWLEAAETGGMLTIAGLRSQPQPRERTTTVHPGGTFVGNDHLWWRGDVRFRLGLPRTPGDVVEKKVPSWQVSPVGLGFEQPSTFFAGSSKGETEGFQNIMMSSWTPGLLRLHASTGKDVYRDFARGGVIGRFANYPGYYLRGFTDLMQSADYPLKGPDVTSFYYHHIPVHLAFTFDWLFAEAELRSKGEIRFPYGQQAGYVWFNNRIFGADGGRVFGDTDARPLFPRGVTVTDSGLNWIAARTADRLWIVLMNDAAEARPAALKLDAAALGLRSGEPVLVRIPGEEKSRSVSAKRLASVSIPPRGLVALGFAAHPEPAKPALPPVAAVPLDEPLVTQDGNVLAWRIRSPFGKDSIYVCLDGGPERTGTVELLLDNDTQPRVVTRYPYEFTVYPFPVDKDAVFRIRTTTTDGAVTTSGSFTLPGTSR